MNLSAIEARVSQGDLSLDALRFLLSCRGECEWLDYKEDLHLDSDPSAAAFTKDALAMKNVGGGYLVIGVKDKSWDPIGLKQKLRYDTKLLRDAIRRCGGIDLDVDIVHHEGVSNSGTGLFAVILVRGSHKRKKRRVPTLVAKDFAAKERYGLRRGEIYSRKGDSTIKVDNPEQLSDLLDSLEENSDQSAIETSQTLSPFAISDGTYRLLEKGFDSFIGRKNLKEALSEAVLRDPRLWIIDVHGPGGVGKSAIVNWAVYEFYAQRAFEAILQLSAKDTKLTDSGIQQSARSLVSLENLLDHILDLFQEPIPLTLHEKQRSAVELFDCWSTLLVLDNMETVQDGRILKFVQGLPPTTKCKVLLTSRHRTGGWELPIPITELGLAETREFVTVKSQESGIVFPINDEIIRKVNISTGGLPLAIQWTLGRYKRTKDLEGVLEAVQNPDSPILEFSFRNIWNVLSGDAKAILAILSIFDSPPDIQQLSIATEWDMERLERASIELAEVTLINVNTQIPDGKIVYVALPITLAFARNQLSNMGDLEISARKRLEKFRSQMNLQQWEIQSFTSTFQKYKIVNDNEKRAVILCRRAQSELFAGNIEGADLLFSQARQTSPNSSYVLALCATGQLVLNNIGKALELIRQAEQRVTKETGALVYSVAARISDAQGDKLQRLKKLEKALTYSPEDVILRHQYGVALSRTGKTQEAIDEFGTIIDRERLKAIPTDTLMMALRTRIINYRRRSQFFEANRDLTFARELLTRHAHLQQNAKFIEELEDDSDNDN